MKNAMHLIALRNRILGVLLLTFAGWTHALQAQQPESLFEQGNTFYEQGSFADAADLYDSVLNMGFESPELYYNLGNAHYKLGHIAPAILNYERALKLDPGHEDAKFNLKLANLKVVDRVTPTPEFVVLKAWHRFRDSRSSGQWAALAVAGFWLAALLGALFLLVSATGWKRVGFFGATTLLVISFALLILAYNKRGLEKDSRQGIVTATNVYVKSAPDPSGTDLFILHEGAKVRISDSVEGWVEVKLEDGKKGWMGEGKVEMI